MGDASLQSIGLTRANPYRTRAAAPNGGGRGGCDRRVWLTECARPRAQQLSNLPDGRRKPAKLIGAA